MIWNVQPVSASATRMQKKSYQAKSRTKNHGHSTPETHPLRYQNDDAWVTNWPFYSNCIIQGCAVKQGLK